LKVPFILALQAFMFFLPVVIWRSVYSSTGMKVRAICETCNIKSNMETEARGKNMEVNKIKKILPTHFLGRRAIPCPRA
jgi:hypothetical protein